MCFNIAMTKTAEQIASFYGINISDIPPLPEYYHVSGFANPAVPVLCSCRKDKSVSKKVELMKWGLIPSWIKTVKDAEEIRQKTLNARCETISRLPSFRGSYKTMRCIAVTDGFYEPHHGADQTWPFFIRRKDRGILSLAGLYAVWTDPETHQQISTFTIITTEANRMLSQVHNLKKRMPVILPDDNALLEKWFDPELPYSSLEKYFIPADFEFLESFPVSNVIYRKGGSNTEQAQQPVKYSGLEIGHGNFN
jgi:putative SOS response-associated peptidase YedK